MKFTSAVVAAIIMANAGIANAAEFVDSPPLTDFISTGVKDCRMDGTVKVPFITWGADAVTIFANGNSLNTLPTSINGMEGISVELERVDVFSDQVKNYLECESPFLRGTQGQLNLAADLTQADPRTEMIAINQLSWSNGGDALVVNSNIREPADLRGKTIAVMAYGPHVGYLARILADAGIGLDEVTIKWTRDLTASDSSPYEAMLSGDVDAAFVIIPDALSLTSGGNIGDGSEGSVQGASILLSTKTASRVISDVYAVRRDFYEANREWVHAFVRSWLAAEESMRESVQADMVQWDILADLLLDDASAVADAQGLWADAESSGFRANVNWADINSRRGFTRVNNEIQQSFVELGLMTGTYNIPVADWDYATFADYVSDTGGVELSRFDANAVNRAITKGVATGTISDNTLYEFQINFEPNNDEFPIELYQDAFEEVIRRASIYSGAVITIEGHSDPLNYLREERAGKTPVELRRIRQSALNLSASRAQSVRNNILELAERSGEPMDASQFAIVPMGISAPLFNPPKTEQEWKGNMRVVFRIVQLEAEASVFTPLN